MITLTLPYPPQVNNYYTIARGRKILSKEARDYCATIGKMWFGKVLADGMNGIPYESTNGRLKVTVILYMPDRRKRDLDNPMKGLLDALTKAGVWQDDSQIDKLYIERADRIVKGGECVVQIEVIK